jgi:hypothetical protein
MQFAMADRKQIMADRLKDARVTATYGTAKAAAEAFGWVVPTYISHENGTRSFDVDMAMKYARAFKVRPGWLLGLDHVPTREGPADTGPRRLRVHTVAAGTWRETAVDEVDEAEEVTIDALDGDDGQELFAVRPQGQSMNLTIPANSVLICRRIPFGKIEAQPGDLVIVERQAHDLTETTCKRLAVLDGQYALLSESDRPEFQKPIMIGKPDVEHYADDEVRVIGVVLRGIQTSFPPPPANRAQSN